MLLARLGTTTLLLTTFTALGCAGSTIDSSTRNAGGAENAGAGGDDGSGGSYGSGGTEASGGKGSGGASAGGAINDFRVPTKHRATADGCRRERPHYSLPTPSPTDPGGVWPYECTTDEECTGGTNGRCTGGAHDGWRCSYDDCFTDADCSGKGTPGVCACDGGFHSGANACLPGTCTVDADCGPAGRRYCSPSFGGCGDYDGVVGYYCHTDHDECLNDDDCTGQGSAGGAPYCAYSPTVGHFACSTQQCVG